jgi:protease I
MRVNRSAIDKVRCMRLVLVAVASLALPMGLALADHHGGPLAGKHIAFLVGEGVQDAEALVPMGYVVSRGAKVTVIGSEPGLVTPYNSDMQVYVQKAIGDVSPEDFDGLVIPGGRSPANLRQHEAIVAFARSMTESGKPVAAICHGPQLLVAAGVLEGKRATCFAGMADELREAGANYTDATMIRDANIITSRLPKDLPAFCAAFERALLE